MDDDSVDIAASKKPSALAVVRPARRAVTASDLADDAVLVEACRRGERRAMEALYHRYKRRVFGLVTRIVGPGESEEVAQEVFVRIFRGLGRFRGDSPAVDLDLPARGQRGAQPRDAPPAPRG